MGVPAFFRWLSRKFPSIVVHCVEEKKRDIDGVKVPVDTSHPNPNDYEFDNLYLDMNGIIHPCCHPENKPAPKNEDEMMVAIFEYIDRIFSIVRPRKLLYMAIDGVAPRAKMNQQRSRRFRAAKESREKREEITRIRTELREKGAMLPPEKEKTEHFDSNCITPGTEFMANLSKCLRYYIADRLNNDPGWKNIKVILSDATVPGEGEHKIMEYIRRQKASPDHDPNTRHCLNGADADLIMLGLATHELHFTIIREEFKPNQPKPCEICGQLGHVMDECMGLPKEKHGEHDELPAAIGAEVEFIFIRLNVLREYLERQLRMEGLSFGYDFERCLDDWVFMCFFVGNDFLPHLPSLQIREGAIDRLVTLYKKVIPRAGGYLSENGIVNLSRVQLILTELGYVEDEIFKKRQEDNIAFKKRMKAKKQREKRQRMSDQGPLWTPGGQFSPQALGSSPFAVTSPRQQAYDMRRQGMQVTGGTPSRNNHAAAADLRALLTPTPDGSLSAPSTPASISAQSTPASSGEKRKKDDDDDDDDPPDNIRLWEDGWKGRYYTNKFGIEQNDEDFDSFRHKVGDAYVEGLCWVLLYYYQGCPSWTWFYPYHYAPFASDFKNIGRLPNTFPRGTKPFKPLEQLMGVFPAASGNFLPPTWRELMSNPDSPIIDFYPVDFEIDLNGKKYAWQGVALLPFVDEKRLLDSLATVYDDLTMEEQKRNQRGKDRLFVRSSYPAADFFKGLYEGGQAVEALDIVTDLTQGMAGKVEPDSEPILPNVILKSPLPNLPDLRQNKTISVRYTDPQYSEGFLFKARIQPGVTPPPRVLKPEDYEENKPYRPVIGMNADRRSFGSLDSSARRMMNFQLNRNAGSPGIPAMNRGPSLPQDPRRSSYDGGRNQYQSNNQNPRFYTPPPSWSQSSRYTQNSQSQGNLFRNQYAAGDSRHSQGRMAASLPHYGHFGNAQSRDPRYHHQQPPPQRDDRRRSYPPYNNRYRPY